MTAGMQHDHFFEEVKTEIADLRHALHATDVEVKLLEEKLEKRDTTSLQQKIGFLEKTIEKMHVDLRSLMAYASQTTASLSQYRDHIAEIDKRLEEIVKLRLALNQVSAETYQVKPGDSLEKIARKFQVSTEALKRENRLSSDKIIVGQELAIPAH